MQATMTAAIAFLQMVFFREDHIAIAVIVIMYAFF